ncbi:MAG: hypothetical protein K6A67_10335 [Bacteroidales bacterium]|nr:hypothetical protein [Bacteroidales bacterium]
METNVNNPLIVRCEHCGGDVNYDITKQKYCCSHCGAEASTADKKAEYRRWKTLRKEIVMRDIGRVKSFSCPACGAQTIAAGESVTALCPFCQNTMIDAQFAGNDIPEVIIPFKISKEEAEAKLREWIKNNSNKLEAKVIERSIQNLTGCYLPYHIVRGAFNSSLRIALHDGSLSDYPFRAYLSHKAVNASKDLSNIFLDGIEPFDFDSALEFDFGHLNHQNAKVQNIGGEELADRISEETKNELYKSFSKKTHTKELIVSLGEDINETIPALLPVYIVKCKSGIAAAVNGQTGKIAVDTGKEKNLTRNWWISPVIATLTVCAVGWIFGGFALGFMGGLVFGLVFYAIASSRHKKVFSEEILTYPKDQEEHNDTRSEFFVDFGKGQVPTVLKFFTPWRIFKTVLFALSVIFLPVLLAIPIQLFRGLPISSIQIGYGAAWYCIPGFITILAAGGLAKAMMYSVPLYYEKLPNGKLKRRKNPSLRTPTFKEILNASKYTFSSKIGCAVIGITLFILIGSILAMIS